MRKFEITIDNEKLQWEEKSYAQIFRNFWAHFMNKDLDKTIETIELVGIRTSDSEHFIAKNGSKKKNIFVKDNYYIYTHLTPKAMEKAYEKFAKGWEGKWNQEQPEEQKQPKKSTKKSADKPEEKVDKPKREVLDPELEAKNQLAQDEYGVNFEDLVPTQKGKITKKYNAQKRAEVKPEEPKADEQPNDSQLTSEELDNVEL